MTALDPCDVAGVNRLMLSVGTFNLNNLFSRFSFRAHVAELPDDEQDVTVTYEFDDDGAYWFRTFRGRLIQPMPEEQRQILAERIKRLDFDILAVQEAEDIEALRDFATVYLPGLYSHVVLIEGNDPRFIDAGILTKQPYPIGALTSWQHAVHPSEPGRRVFSRDLLQVEILNESRSRRLLTVFNTHLKSHFVSPDQDPVIGAQEANEQRLKQAEIMAEIIEARTRPDSPYIIVGDMNDPPDSQWLAPLVGSGALQLVNGLANAKETRPPKTDVPPPPASGLWTHRFKESGKPAQYELFDHVWLSPSLADNLHEAWIDRRQNHGGDGSDHDPAWVVLDL